jgi:hypothetical protein
MDGVRIDAIMTMELNTDMLDDCKERNTRETSRDRVEEKNIDDIDTVTVSRKERLYFSCWYSDICISNS